MNVEKKQAVPTVEDIIALMEPDVIYSQQEFVERTGRTAGTIQTILDLAVARRQMERIVVRKRNHYRLPAPPIENGQPNMRTHSELAGWEKQWRQFRAMCEAARPRNGHGL